MEELEQAGSRWILDVFARAVRKDATKITEWYTLTEEGNDAKTLYDPVSGKECQAPHMWTLPNVFGEDDDGKLIEVTHIQMPPGYATRHPPSNELACDFCGLKRASLSGGAERRRVKSGNFLVKQCGHSLCMRVECLRKHADCKEEREHCDICYKHWHLRQKYLTEEAAINMEGSQLVATGLLRYQDYNGYEDNDEDEDLEPRAARLDKLMSTASALSVLKQCGDAAGRLAADGATIDHTVLPE